MELTFWAMGAEGEEIEKLLPSFHILHPEIHVNVVSIPWNSAHEKLLTAYAGKSTPDVCQLGNTWIPEFQVVGGLVALDSFIVKSSIVNKESFFEGIWNTNIIGKKMFGIPWYVDTRLLFYRTDIFSKVGYDVPPKNWTEWLDVSRKIKKDSKNPQREYAIHFPIAFNTWQIPVILILDNGGRLLKDNHCYGAFDDPATVEALQFYLSFFDEGLAPRSMTEVVNIYQGFASAAFSMLITGPWDVNEIRKQVPELNHRWSTAVMPQKVNCNSVAGGSSLVIFKNSQHPEVAWKLIEFLSQPKIQEKFFRLTRDLPAVKKAWEFKEIQTDNEINAFYQQLEHVIQTPKIAEWEQIAVKIQEHLEEVIFDRIGLQEAIKKLNQSVDYILEKRRWLLTRGLITQ